MYTRQIESGRKVPCVAIGGLNISNVSRIRYQSTVVTKDVQVLDDTGLDGVAVVSAIMGAEDPGAASQGVHAAFRSQPAFVRTPTKVEAVENLLRLVPEVLDNLKFQSPLCHNMTNLVVQNFAASVTLAIGASPIMSNYGEEAKDLATLGGALVINMGTVTPEGLGNYVRAIRAYNAAGNPVVFDPVGAGATAVRREAIQTLLNAGYFTLIKGNENEIRAVLGTGEQVQQKGVDR